MADPVVIDHLNYIRIAGLEGDAEECFQGLQAGSGTTSTTTGGTTSLEWGTIPEEAVTMIQEYTDKLNTWLQSAADYTPDESARGVKGRGLPAVLKDTLPAIPAIAATVATGGAALPAVATVMASQVVMNLVGSSVANYAAQFDENSPLNLLKKALLYTKPGETEAQSILKDALLYTLTTSGADEIRSVLHDKLDDLALVDAELKYADNTSLHVKGKVLQY